MSMPAPVTGSLFTLNYTALEAKTEEARKSLSDRGFVVEGLDNKDFRALAIADKTMQATLPMIQAQCSMNNLTDSVERVAISKGHSSAEAQRISHSSLSSSLCEGSSSAATLMIAKVREITLGIAPILSANLSADEIDFNFATLNDPLMTSVMGKMQTLAPQIQEIVFSTLFPTN